MDTKTPRRDDVIATLRAHWDELRALGIQQVWLFGSVARDEACSTSDIDLMLQFDHAVELFEYAAAQAHLQEMLNVPRLDVVMSHTVYPQLAHSIDKEKILVA